MAKSCREPRVDWRVGRTVLGRLVIGLLLAACLYGVMTIGIPYFREQRIGREIESLNGTVHYAYCGPSWLPTTVQDRLICFRRIVSISLWKDDGHSINRMWRLRGFALEKIAMPIEDDELKCLQSLSNLVSLQLINQSRITDSGLAHWRGLSSLVELDLEGTNVSELSGLKDLHGLETLRLSGTQTTDAGLANISGLASLQSLNLKGTKITDAGLKNLEKLKRLKNLNLEDTQITDEALPGLAQLPSLEWLSLGKTAISDSGLEHLGKSKCLVELQIRDTRISYAGRLKLPDFEFVDNGVLAKNRVAIIR